MKTETNRQGAFITILIILIILLAAGLAASLIFLYTDRSSNTLDQLPQVETPPAQDSGTEAKPEPEPEIVPETEPEPESEPEPEPEPEPQIDGETLSAAIAEADRLNAGYDPEAAIAHLKALEHWDTSEDIASKIQEYEAFAESLQPYTDMANVTHVFFHSLIVDNSRAFDGDSEQNGYNMYMTTIPEFETMLEILYEKGYVLVSPYDVAHEVTAKDGTTRFQYGEIMLPEGKTPFMMSQDDLNYYGYMIGSIDGINETPARPDRTGDGFAHKIVLDEDGMPVCEYMEKDGTIVTGDYDLVPILERFIREHPDFSYRGARAILAFTGYEGVLGYRTKPSYENALGSEAYAAEVEAARTVANRLQELGWDLASHSYGHISYGERSADRIAVDSDKWLDTVASIIGETDILIFPHGSDIAGLENYSFENAKFSVLYEDGFRYFFNVNGVVAWHEVGEHWFRGNRRNLDGYRMFHHPFMVEDLFAVEDVWDPDRPLPVPEIG